MANLPDKAPDLAKEIVEKFYVNRNTFIRDVKDNPKDRIMVEIGDIKQPDFKPQAKIMRWDNEVNFSLRAEEHPAATVETRGKQIIYKTPEYEVHQYEIDAGDIGEDGGLEFEWVLPKKPKTNVLTATIQTKGLNFYYQPPLTQEEIDEGADRPENVVGSYAVYHKTKGGLNSSRGHEYKAGKAFHIYRPKITDDNGSEIWGELNIDEAKGELTVTVDQTFLDNASYPVIVDPTFGYTSIGTSGSTSVASDIVGSTFTSPSDFNSLDSVSACLERITGGTGCKAIVVLDSTLAILTNGVSNELAVTGTPAFRTFTFGTAPTMSASTDYVLCAIGGGSHQMRYDAGDTNQGLVDTSNNYTTPTDPTDGSRNNNKYSIYATYTPTTDNYPSVGATITSDINGDPTFSMSHTVDANTDVLVVVAGNHQGDITNITWDGNNMTEQVEAVTSANERTQIWTYANPSATTANIVMTFSGGSGRSMTALNVIDGQLAATPPTASDGTGFPDPTNLTITTDAKQSLVVFGGYSEGDFLTLQTNDFTEAANLQDQSFENHAVAYGEVPPSTSKLIRWDMSSGQRTARVALALEEVAAPAANTRRYSLSTLGVG